MIVVVFRARWRDGIDLQALEALALRMYELAASMPGFVAYKDFSAADGESVSIVEFTDAESLLAWREHPEHVAAQEQGRREFMAEYSIQVCTLQRTSTFRHTG
jgi:heme-degrading monooxygenase HmoA